jgi:hypothetical protein
MLAKCPLARKFKGYKTGVQMQDEATTQDNKLAA